MRNTSIGRVRATHHVPPIRRVRAIHHVLPIMVRFTHPTIALAIICLAAFGCGRGGPKITQMHGSVTCGGEAVPLGQVTFVPIEGTPGMPAPVMIFDGQYRFQKPGGVSPGKYRVQVDAHKKTGRQVEAFNGIEMGLIDEEIRLGPEIYAGEKSPLTVEVGPGSPDRFDIELPDK